MIARVDPAGARDGAMELTVAVLTFKRDEDLAQVLPLLVEQVRANRTPELSIRILVIDNDPAGSAKAGVSAASRSSDVPIIYVNETTPGISAARNRALSESSQSRLLVFIDDDEHPTEGWLSILLATWRKFLPTAIIGPVVSEYDVPPEPWVVQGNFFARRRMPTGTPTGVASTNNLLLDMDFVRQQGIRFDLSLGLSGGEDTMFSRQLVLAGGVIIWCDEAIVVDRVPADRVTRRWVVLRSVSSGNAWSITSVKLAGSAAQRAKTRVGLTASGGIRVLGGSARLATGVVLRRMDLRARGIRTLARGAGMVTGAWGYKYLEYRRPSAGD